MAGDCMARNLLPFFFGVVSPVAAACWLFLLH
jgi:hypothetical protein